MCSCRCSRGDIGCAGVCGAVSLPGADDGFRICVAAFARPRDSICCLTACATVIDEPVPVAVESTATAEEEVKKESFLTTGDHTPKRLSFQVKEKTRLRTPPRKSPRVSSASLSVSTSYSVSLHESTLTCSHTSRTMLLDVCLLLSVGVEMFHA